MLDACENEAARLWAAVEPLEPLSAWRRPPWYVRAWRAARRLLRPLARFHWRSPPR